MREEAGTTRSQRPSRWAVDVPVIPMSPTSRRFLLLLGVVAGALPGGEEEEEEDADDEDKLAETVGLLLVDRGLRRRDRRLDAEDADANDDAWAGPGRLGLRKEGAAGKPLRILALCVLPVGRVWRVCGYAVVGSRPFIRLTRRSRYNIIELTRTCRVPSGSALANEEPFHT